ncbi:NPCBM/NEW2 domain-containing protein [Asticcacaulis sp. EMRT-3]|uniref:NPCBM/NEW2 domain-containing protein n=1 Tax=Asticcacaulis sp. EMRT-3 TaxID=3040349 RepID=UPI0024AEA4FC|nr:NPCBM/NEW2 domain-containing protein [Asticcacaulis sp. EMRT-3]MDI7775742.1 NPCBM/NEW2 domain-containing protein [Asticcacaulis sp. EMRT-3]
MKPISLLATTALIALLSLPAHAETTPKGVWLGHDDGAAQTPPMGWNSWNAFRTEVDEDKVMGAAQALVDDGLAKLGYVYVNLDDGWWLKRRQPDGRMIIRTRIFPSAATADGASSFRPFTDRLHAMGLKAGIYTDIGRNACSQAYNLDSPNLPEGTPQERQVGLDGHVKQDIGLYFKDWGFDYIKIDACGLADYAPGSKRVIDNNYIGLTPEIDRSSLNRTDDAKVEARYAEVAAALKAAKPDNNYVFSICDWGMADVRRWGKDVGSSWRTSSDITPGWSSMLHNYDSAVGRALYAGPGHWNDPDILYIGEGDFDANHLTEARTHFSLWAMLDAPLLISYDLRKAPKSLLDIWGNADLVAVDQDRAGNQATIAYDSEDAQILVKTMADGHKVTALFNRTASPQKVTLMASHLKLRSDAPISLTDLWSKAQTRFTGDTTITLAPHETRVFSVQGPRQLADGMYLSEMPGSVNVADDGVRHPEADPFIHRNIDPWAGTRSGGSRPMYAGWGGAQADMTPYGQTLQIDGTPYESGIGVLGNSLLQVKNIGGYAHFRATVGVDDSTRNRDRAVIFSVWADGKLVRQTPPMRFGDAPRDIDADIAGHHIIELQAVNDTAQDEIPVVVTWGMARLEK